MSQFDTIRLFVQPFSEPANLVGVRLILSASKEVSLQGFSNIVMMYIFW